MSIRLEFYLEQELATQEMWITGNNHISIYSEQHLISSNTPVPNSYSEMVFYLLLEQIETQNGKKNRKRYLRDL